MIRKHAILSRKQHLIRCKDLLRKHQKEISILFSNPCFEVWYLFHYSKSTGRPRDYKQVEKRLKKYIEDYEKARDYSAELFPKTARAVLSAKKKHNKACREVHHEAFHEDNMGVTEVYQFFEHLGLTIFTELKDD